MTKKGPLALILALGMGFAAAPAHADGVEKKEEQEEKTMSFGLQALQERFEASSPNIGEGVPDVPVYTAEGEKVSFRDLVLGHYSVVVFGCLT
jgi:hypothetical protein